MQVAMIVGSCATESCEPRQVRKEATVSSNFRVPQGCLIRANYMGYVCRSKSTTGAQSIKFYEGDIPVIRNVSFCFMTNYTIISMEIMI